MTTVQAQAVACDRRVAERIAEMEREGGFDGRWSAAAMGWEVGRLLGLRAMVVMGYSGGDGDGCLEGGH